MSAPAKPFAPACERNRDPILSVIEPMFRDRSTVLEIGSGTGQHAVYFAARMPHLQWQTSDVEEALPGIRMWLDEAALPNTPAPLALDVSVKAWPACPADAVFTANTVHIVAWERVQDLFAGAGRLLGPGGLLVVYGPFNYNGAYTSDSNARFDTWLRERDPASAIRDFEAVDALASDAGMILRDDRAMPANNRILCWEKTA